MRQVKLVPKETNGYNWFVMENDYGEHIICALYGIPVLCGKTCDFFLFDQFEDSIIYGDKEIPPKIIKTGVEVTLACTEPPTKIEIDPWE